MKKLLDVFELTVAQQRAIIILLGALVLFVALKSYRDARLYPPPALPPLDQPSPSPGIRP